MWWQLLKIKKDLDKLEDYLEEFLQYLNAKNEKSL